MLEFLREHQQNMMMVLAGVCFVMSGFVLFSRTISTKRRTQLFVLGISAMMLLIFDRHAYQFRGVDTPAGYVMVRLCNFMVYSLTLVVMWFFNEYLEDFLMQNAEKERRSHCFLAARILMITDEILIVLTQFIGFYYYFDDGNYYQRGKGFLLCFIFPLTITVLQLSQVYEYRKYLRPIQSIPLFLFTSLPIIATVAQVFLYGLSLTNITLVSTVMVLYVFAIIETDDEVERAHQKEIELLRNEEYYMRSLMVQTAYAFSEAIEAKDKYTNGHSRRVADYSMKIARLAGKSDKECREVYIAALLHDVGKIGIPNSIINKPGKLSEEEYEAIRQHPTVGNQILSKITVAGYLSIGAHYHHERIDGKGYPDGLKGDEIPDIARIIAVADAYDAMTSKRSYRDVLPQEAVRDEIIKGLGTQFDNTYGRIMLKMMAEDIEYRMRESDEDMPLD